MGEPEENSYMISFLRRYRWWLIIACLAAVAISWWQLSGPRGRFTREQYDRIRLGMTPAEVALSMGSAPSGRYRLTAGTNDETEVWVDECVYIYVFCSPGKAVLSGWTPACRPVR